MVMLINAHPHGDADASPTCICIFEFGSKLRGSCAPNVAVGQSATKGKSAFVALSEIKPLSGEQLTGC